MKTLLTTCVESFAVDQLTNRLSLFHIFDEINAASFPILVPSMTVVVFWEAEASDLVDGPLNFDIAISLDNDQLGKISGVFEMGGRSRGRHLATLNGVVIQKPGRLIFRVFVKEAETGYWDMPVNGVGITEAPKQPNLHSS